MPENTVNDAIDSMFADMIAERDCYRQQVTALIARVTDSDNRIEILSDFLTALVYTDCTDADPAEILEHFQNDWDGDCFVDEDNLCDTYGICHEDCDCFAVDEMDEDEYLDRFGE